jgi:hypothetical protein
LGEVVERMGWKLHAFVLMGNHYHLLVETPEANLVEGMRWFQSTYTQRFNSRHKQWGHLFQGRYKALLVDEGEYFSSVANYIHLNPARASGFDLEAGKLSDYKWSSYPGYLRPAKRPEWLTVNRVLESFGQRDDAKGRSHYRERMKKRVLEILHSANPKEADEQWKKIRRGWVLGSDDFCERMQGLAGEVMKGKLPESFSGESRRLHDETRAEEIAARGLRLLSLTEKALSELRKGDDRKKVIAWMIRKRTSVRNDWISTRLNMGHPNSISRHVGEVERVQKGTLSKLRQQISECED